MLKSKTAKFKHVRASIRFGGPSILQMLSVTLPKWLVGTQVGYIFTGILDQGNEEW